MRLIFHIFNVNYIYINYIFIIVLKESLQAKGVINKVKANIRSEIFKSIDDEDQEKPKLSYENLIVNELIREYAFIYNYIILK